VGLGRAAYVLTLDGRIADAGASLDGTGARVL
jgi:hypothetical protein